MTLRPVGLALVLIAACSPNHHDTGDDAVIDAPSIDSGNGSDGSGSNGSDGSGSDGSGSGSGSAPVNVYVVSATPVLYVAYREGNGAWTSLVVAGSGQYQLPVDGPYEAVAVCTDGSNRVYVNDQAELPSDGDNYIYCNGAATSAAATTTVTGTMEQPGTVWLEGHSATGSAAPWAFSIHAPSSTTADLLAIGSSSMMIERGIAVGGGGGSTQSLAPIDLAGSGTPYDTDVVSVTGTLDDGSNRKFVDIYTDSGAAEITTPWDQPTIDVPPNALVTSTDFIETTITSTDAAHTLSWTSDDPSIGVAQLLPALYNVSFTGVTATWTSLPAADYVQVQLDSATVTSVFGASRAWMASAGVAALSPMTGGAPGWQSAWTIDTPLTDEAFEIENLPSWGVTTSSFHLSPN